MKHGFLLIDKPVGPTSHDIVYAVRKTLSEKKIGHLGTLDPAASGLMVLAVGAKALKAVELFNDLQKQYMADVHLGVTSVTYDQEGPLEVSEPKPGWVEPDSSAVQLQIDESFTGFIDQVPPSHSAVHIDGKRSYQLARAGKLVEPPVRQVQITECSVVSYAYPNLQLKVGCSSGTYIRSLAHDLGQKLHCGAYLSGLRRTMVGEWSVDFAVPPEDVGWSYVVPLYEVLARFPSIDLTDEEAKKIGYGQHIARQVKRDIIAWHNGLPIAIMIPAKDGSNSARARKVFA